MATLFRLLKNFYKRFRIHPIDTSAFYYEALDFTISGLMGKKEREFDSLTGKAIISNRQVVRPMPLLTIANGEVVLKKMIEVKIDDKN